MNTSDAPLHTERDVLLLMLRNQRTAFRNAFSGLDDAQARCVPCASELSLSSLLKHVIDGEEAMTSRISGKPRTADADPVSNWLAAWDVGVDDTVEGLLARFDSAARETERVVDVGIDLDRDVSVLPEVARFLATPGVRLNVRYLLAAQVEEQARHAGHADIIRQSIDGARAAELADS